MEVSGLNPGLAAISRIGCIVDDWRQSQAQMEADLAGVRSADWISFGQSEARPAVHMASAFRPALPIHIFRLPPAKPRRLQPGQLAWCSANVPGFVDLLPAECGPAAGYHDLRNVRIVAVYEGSPLEFGAADISEASVSLKPRIRVRAAMTERADDQS
jgi:hypothetical protein